MPTLPRRTGAGAGHTVHILFLNAAGGLGGAESVLLNLIAGLRQDEPDWSLSLIVGEAGPLVDKARALGVDVSVLPFPDRIAKLGDSQQRFAGWGLQRLALLLALLAALPAAVLYARKLGRAMRRRNPTLVHTIGYKMHWFGYCSRPRLVPLLCHVHDYVRQRPVMRRLLSLYSRGCAVVVANSCSVASDVRAVAAGRTPVVAIHNGVDLARFGDQGPSWSLDSAEAPSDGAVRVGLVATFARWKGHFVFLRAIAKIPSEIPVIAYIIGGPIYSTDGSQLSRDELSREIARLGVESRVRLAGFVDDIPAALRALDVVVHASTEPEPFGMTIVEGMASGKAVIASNAGGARELFTDGVDALGHRPGDANELAAQLRRVVEDPMLRRRLGAAARRTVSERFDQKAVTARFRAVYGRISEASATFHDLSPLEPHGKVASVMDGG